MYIKKCTIQKAIKELNVIYLSFSSKPNKLKERKEKININVKNKKKENLNLIPVNFKENIKYIREYLIYKRHISEKLVNYLIHNNYIGSDKRKNCVFYNENHTYAFLRSTISNFKQHTGTADFIIYKNDINPLSRHSLVLSC